MIGAVAQLKGEGAIPEQVVLQTGVGGLRPEGMEAFETLPFETVLDLLRDSEIVICHGGTGSLVTALRQGCRVIVMPRKFERGEHYDNHQSEITEAFQSRGLVTKADSVEELRAVLPAVRQKKAVMATTDMSELVGYLQGLLAEA
jgi:UDP-N-acetylglucosamine transferase subunit ALG13